MTSTLTEDPALFFAHAITLEEDSAERYRELADAMSVHNQSELQHLFEQMASYSDRHAAEVRARSAELDLPLLAPWEYQWPDEEAPETLAHGDAHYLMTGRDALELALDSERRGAAFYACIRDGAQDATVREAAGEFADEEGEHVALLEYWLRNHPREPGEAVGYLSRFDLDPPNEPE